MHYKITKTLHAIPPSIKQNTHMCVCLKFDKVSICFEDESRKPEELKIGNKILLFVYF